MLDKMPNMDIFMSYTYSDKKLALYIKNNLEKVGFVVFLAPDDIIGGTKFLSIILDKIKACHVFIHLISENTHISLYADHEAGLAIGFGKKILPVCINGESTYGFLREYHGINIDDDKWESKIKEIQDTVMVLTDTAKNYMDLLINNLVESASYLDAHHLASILETYTIFTEDQIISIGKARLHNTQIYQSFLARPIVDHILKKHQKILPAETRDEFDAIVKMTV